MDGTMQNWVELALATPVVIWAGLPFFHRAQQSITNRSPNMWTLIGLGTMGTRIQLGLWFDQCGISADYCLSLCTRSGDANVNNGNHR